MGMGWTLMLGIGGLVILAAFAASVAWVWKDANRRGQPGFLVAVLAAVPFWPLSLLVWVLVRPETTVGSVVPPAGIKPFAVIISVLLMILVIVGLLSEWLLRDLAITAERNVIERIKQEGVRGW